MFLCCLLRYFLNFSTCSVERKSKNVLSTVLSTEHVKKFKKYLNKQHKNISFTSEMEQNGSLSFLDIKINHKNNKFVTSVYRKSTFIGVSTNFESFTGKSSIDLRARLRRTIEKNIPFCKLNVVFRVTCRLDNMHRFKDSLKKKILSGIVYRYTCSNCKVTYYEKTIRHFLTRVSEHTGTSNLTGKRIKNAKELAISDHLLQCESPITFDDFDYLASDSNKFKLLIKESVFIKHDKPVLNRTTKSYQLDLFD